MKALIFLGWKPVISETFIRNELDILVKANIKVRIYYSDYFKSNLPDMDLGILTNRLFYIPPLPKILRAKILYILKWHIKIVISFPSLYFNLLFMALSARNKSVLRIFFRIVPFVPSIIEYNPDIIYSHYSYEQALFAAYAKSLLGTKYFIVMHERNLYGPLTLGLPSVFWPSYIILKKREMASILYNRYSFTNKIKMKVIPWGIDNSFFTRSRKTNKNKVFKILSISQLSEKKGLIYLLKACQLLKQDKTKFMCTIIGSGTEYRYLSEYIDKNNLSDKIKLRPATGNIYILKEYLNRADLFVLPSVIDSFNEADIIPNVLLEAMSMEIPVVTTRCSGMEGIIKEGQNGFFVEEKNAIDLAYKIKHIMDLQPVKREKIGKKARVIVMHKFNKESQGKKFVEFLKSQVKNE